MAPDRNPEPSDTPAHAGEWSSARLGRTLRALRTSRGLRLADLARESGLSAPFLSQVEQGQSDISVGRLIRIAQALHVSVTDLIELPPPGGRPLVRASERASVHSPTRGLTVELLASRTDGHTYALSTLGPHVVADARSYRIPGQDYSVFMLSGRAVIEFGTGDPVTLEAGDSISFMSEEFRSMRNLGATPTSHVWISVPGG
ncbi:MAG TPA: XRE family transcriptional regulator [Solirubrobacteraceae bacterium]|nr:XRE family transcriptional regulator [Solirubrobacteraceae bacterium]